jgi:hypothetical protein
LSLTIMCGLFAIAFTFNSSQITWLWEGNEAVGVILAIAAILFGIQLIHHQRLLKNQKQ